MWALPCANPSGSSAVLNSILPFSLCLNKIPAIT